MAVSAYGCGRSSSCLDCDDGSGADAGSTGKGGSGSSGKGGTPGASGAAGKGAAGSGEGGANSGGNGPASGGAVASGGSAAAGGAGSSAGAAAGGTGGASGADDGGEGADGGTGTGGALAGSGGNSGSGQGGMASEIECESAEECLLFSDCCSCLAVSGQESHEACDLVCVQSRCAALQITQADVTCSFGRCVLSRSCDASRVTCREAPPTCEEGALPSVDGNCWGGCLPATECESVTDCDACPSGSVCIEFQAQAFSFRCVTPGPGCEKGNYCECMPNACGGGPAVCTDENDKIACPCLAC